MFPNNAGRIRIRGGQRVILDGHSPDRAPLEALAARTVGAFVTWEEQGLVLPNGSFVGPRYALWRPIPDIIGPVHDPVPEDPPVLHPPQPDEPLLVTPELAPQPEANPQLPRSKRPRGPRTVKHKNITRIDHPAKRTHGYFVRVQWQGQRRTKFFSDKKCGDRLSALADAIAWRDAMEKELGKPRTERQVVGKARNNTGIVGIRRRKRGGQEVIEATWVIDGKRQGRTSYSIARHGEKGALKKAIAARRKGEQSRQRSPSGQ